MTCGQTYSFYEQGWTSSNNLFVVPHKEGQFTIQAQLMDGSNKTIQKTFDIKFKKNEGMIRLNATDVVLAYGESFRLFATKDGKEEPVTFKKFYGGSSEKTLISEKGIINADNYYDYRRPCRK